MRGHKHLIIELKDGQRDVLIAESRFDPTALAHLLQCIQRDLDARADGEGDTLHFFPLARDVRLRVADEEADPGTGIGLGLQSRAQAGVLLP
ncbi:hypothetical protein OG301_35215 [Streptomyces platensis]|uniref:hypothetical protein n=1 Tax=Streptomyces platensis TaxID=58346 RepID=UPI002ED6A370|nr:hypothetical protein OG301_35215 [Streptomyces platensis]